MFLSICTYFRDIKKELVILTLFENVYILYLITFENYILMLLEYRINMVL